MKVKNGIGYSSSRAQSGILRIHFLALLPLLCEALHMVARWYWQLRPDLLSSNLAEKSMPIYYCSSKNSGLALITLICVPCFFLI